MLILWVDTRAYFTAATEILNRYILNGVLFMIGAFVGANFVCFSLVFFGSNLSSNVGFSRYLKKLQDIIQLSPHILNVTVNLLLSDAWLLRDKSHWNSRLELKKVWSIFLSFGMSGIFYLITAQQCRN